MANKEVTWLSGQIGKIIYDDKKGFMIFLLKTGKRSIVVKGEFLQIPKSSDIRILGSYVTDPKYGRQFAAISYQFLVPDNMNLWKKWLGSGVIKGMRGKTAQKIIDHFGKDTMDILNGHPKKLAKVPGIGINRARVICNKFQEHTQNADTLLTLCNYGVPIHMGKKIVKKYGADTIKQLQENPYQIADQVTSMGFKTMDPIALRIGIKPESQYRMNSAFLYLLHQAEQEGHVYLPKNILLKNASELLNFPVSILETALAQSDLKIVDDEEILVYRPWKYKEEQEVSKILSRLTDRPRQKITKKEELLLTEYSKGK